MSMPLPVVPELSRSFKYQRILASSRDGEEGGVVPKKKREDDSTSKKSNHAVRCCFEVRQCNNGVGMFATRPIATGDLIIDSEEPIVSTALSLFPSRKEATASPFCRHCATPIGSLRKDHVQAPPDLELPGLEKGDVGLVFSQEEEEETSAWCSKYCQNKGHALHSYARDSNNNNEKETTTKTNDSKMRLKNFLLEEKENSKVLQLAIQSILLALLSKKDAGLLSKKVNANHNYFWWEDYGSHPLWWTIGDPKHRTHRKTLARTFATLLRDWLGKGQQQEQPPTKRRRTEQGDEFFSLDTVGCVLGMLQCNVMEFSYPSPLEQYMEQAEHFVREGEEEQEEQDRASEDCGGGEPPESGMHPELARGCEWLRERYQKDTKNTPASDDAANKGTNSALPGPVLGSGLYPLLTLANHDCHPNASIEFLRESNRGSMVALRPIRVGEEVCITYVPNGGGIGPENEDDQGDFFQHFAPTRTWQWLNENHHDDAESDTESGASNDMDNEDSSSHATVQDNKAIIDEQADGLDSKDSHSTVEETTALINTAISEEESHELEDGADYKERGKVLLEYDFVCKCARCHNEEQHQ